MVTSLLTIILIGIVLHLVNKYIGLPAVVAEVINVLLVLLLCLWLLGGFGIHTTSFF